MYIEGTAYNLESRIHQNCVDQESYTQFRTEFLGYSLSKALENKINKELVYKKKSALNADDEYEGLLLGAYDQDDVSEFGRSSIAGYTGPDESPFAQTAQIDE